MVALALRLIALDVVILMHVCGLCLRDFGIVQRTVELGGHEDVLGLSVGRFRFLDHLRCDGAAAVSRARTRRRLFRLKIFIFVQNGFQGEFLRIQIKRNVLWRAIKFVHMVNSFL